MSHAVRSLFRTSALLLTLAATGAAAPLAVQTGAALPAPMAQANRVPADPNFAPQTQLTGHLPAWVTQGAQVSSRAVDLSAPLRLVVVVRRAPAVQAAFEQFLAAQQTPGSPYYHQWLTPQQVGALFGPTPSDLAALTGWLAAQGLTIDSVAPSGVMIDLHGPTAAVGNAFRTSFAYFSLNGTPRLSAVSEPSVPTALAPLFNSIHGLTEVPVYPTDHIAPAQPGWANHSATTPLFTVGPTGGPYTHYMTPNDFAVIYDVNSVYNGGNKGTTIGAKAQHVAVIGQSRVSATDISEYATNVGIASYTVNTIIPTNGVDPGPVCTTANANTCTTAGDQGEQTLDVDRVIGTSPGAVVDLVVSANTTTGGGIDTAAQYNVSTLLDPIMTISYGGCEAQAGGSSADSFINTLASTGAAEGISTFVSSGDSGVDACAASFTPNTTTYTASINFLCSSQYVTCVGGTEFNDATGNYWATTNGAGDESALSYIPEGGWNEPVIAATNTTPAYYIPSASGGGPSAYVTQPAFQNGVTGIPGSTARYTPDVAYPAAGHDGYYACLAFMGAGYDCAQNGGVIFSGTSAAAPTMAGVAALLNTKAGVAEGNINPLLYKLAASSPAAFHDITVATSGVGTCVLTTPSMCNNSTPGAGGDATTYTGGLQGYAVGTGYNQVTGLGSIDVANFLTAATTVTTISTTLAVTATTNPISAGQTDTFKATLTPASTSANGAATGTVQFYSNGVAFGSAVTLVNNVATSIAEPFATAGTESITAVYSGDSNYATSTSPAYSLTVNTAPSFSITPASTALTLFSGATTGNTDTITLASLNGFAGSVTLACTVTNAGGTAAGTCGLAPAAVTLATGTPGSSVLTINTTPGTAGTLSVTVTGTSGTTVVTSGSVTVTLNASSFTMTAAPTTLNLTSGATTGNTSVVTLTSVNGFAGTVAVTCAVSSAGGNATGSCTASPASVTLAANATATTTVTLTSTAGTTGTLTLTVSGSGTPTGGTIATTAKTTIAATLITPTVTLAAPALNFTSGATTGNSSTVTVTSTDGFAGSVALTCSILATSGSPAYPATCAVAPSSVTVTANGTATAAVSITSTTASANATPVQAGLDRAGWAAGALFATLLCLLPFRRRRAFRALTAFALLAVGLAALSGCGGGGTPPAAVKSSAGTYTVTVTGTSTGFTTPATTTFTVTIN